MGRPASSTGLSRVGARVGGAVALVPALLRLALVAAAVLVGLQMGVAPAHADNQLVSSTPGDGDALTASPTAILLTFAQPLGPANTVVASCNGNPFNIGQPSVGAARTSLTVQVVNTMPKGTCNVVATISAADGTPNGTFKISFSISSGSSGATTTTVADGGGDGSATSTTKPATKPTSPGSTTPAGPAPRVEGPLGLARMVGSLGLAALLGGLVLIVMAWPEGVEYILTVRFLRGAWALAMLGTVLTVVFLTAQATGRTIGASVSPAAWLDLKDSTPGKAVLLRVALTGASVWSVMRPERCVDQSTQLPSLALPILAVATYGFARPGGDLAAVGMVAGIGHAIAMSVWLGGLLLLTRVVLAGPGEEDLVHAVRGFRRLSGPAIAITIVTGAVQTFRLDRGGALFSTNHGRVLLLKALVVGAMVFVGFATRQFIAQRVARVDAMTAPLAARLRRATGAEALAGVVVLGLSAWMMGLAPGGLTVTDTAHKSYGYRQGHVVEGDLDLTVSLTGVVGPNGVRVDVLKPTTGLSNVVITFLPPPDSGGSQVVLTLPGALKGTGAAVLDAAAGVPLNSPGVWTMQITATTSSGPKTAQKTFTLPVLG